MIKSWLQIKFIHLITKHLFNAVSEQDILRQSGTDILFEGRPLKDEVVIKLKEDAKNFKDSLLWKVLLQEAKYQANVKMYEQSKSIGDIMFAKAMLYAVDLIEKKVLTLTF